MWDFEGDSALDILHSPLGTPMSSLNDTVQSAGAYTPILLVTIFFSSFRTSVGRLPEQVALLYLILCHCSRFPPAAKHHRRQPADATCRLLAKKGTLKCADVVACSYVSITMSNDSKCLSIAFMLYFTFVCPQSIDCTWLFLYISNHYRHRSIWCCI